MCVNADMAVGHSAPIAAGARLACSRRASNVTGVAPITAEWKRPPLLEELRSDASVGVDVHVHVFTRKHVCQR